MLDAWARKIIDPPLNRAGKTLADIGVSADAVTLVGLGLGLLGAALIAAGLPHIALLFLALSRLSDGLDGAVARATRKTDFGGFLDTSCDFLFYGAVPLAFVILDPTANAVAGAYLLTSFYFNGATFLGFSVQAEKRGMSSTAQGQKSLYYSDGILEGTETIAFFAVLCLFPDWFAVMAWIFGTLCFLTGALRIAAARKVFSD